MPGRVFTGEDVRRHFLYFSDFRPGATRQK